MPLKTRFKNIAQAYSRVVRWNGDNASDLFDALRRLFEIAPEFLLDPLPFILDRFHYARGLRFDLTEIREPLIAIDRKGLAITGNYRAMKITQLQTIR